MTLRPLRGLSSNPETPAAKRLRPLAHSGWSYLEFPGNLMSWLTLGVSQNYLGVLHLALLSLSGFDPYWAGFHGQEETREFLDRRPRQLVNWW